MNLNGEDKIKELQECHERDKKKIEELEEIIAKQKHMLRLEYEKRDAIETKYWVMRSEMEYIERAGHAGKKTSLKQFLRFQYHKRRLLKKPVEYWEPVFDAEEYAELNRDLCQKTGNDVRALLRHFILYGMNEGRRANSSFDVRAYMKYSPDVAQYYDGRTWECYLHYIEIGWKQERRANW